MSDYSAEIACKLYDFLTAGDSKVMYDEEEGLIQFHAKDESTIGPLRYLIKIHEDGFTVLCEPWIHADPHNEAQINAVSRFLHDVNIRQRYGHFELDTSDGELRHKFSQFCGESIPDALIIAESLVIPISMFERYSPGFLSIIFAGADPDEALRKCVDD